VCGRYPAVLILQLHNSVIVYSNILPFFHKKGIFIVAGNLDSYHVHRQEFKDMSNFIKMWAQGERVCSAKVTEKQIKEANKEGMEGEFRSYYTPVLDMSRNLGEMGIDLQDAPVVKGWRYGEAPENFISWNARDGAKEHGLSLMGLGDPPENENEEGWQSMFFGNRKKYSYTGVYVGTGSDDEPIILCMDAEDWDS
jgi:hypothetical protein